MSGLILIVMIIVMVVVLFVKLVKQKPVKNLLISYVVILGGYHLLISQKCGPNSADVKAMKPQAEVITNYILKHGIPKSMAEIPNLPYPWDRCERESWNVEYCFFNIDKSEYRSRLYFRGEKYINIHVEVENQKSETGIYTRIVKRLNDGIDMYEIIEYLKAYSNKNDGICNPMRM